MDVHKCFVPGCAGWNEACGADGNAAVVWAAELLLNASKFAKSALECAFCAAGVHHKQTNKQIENGMRNNSETRIKLWDECVQHLGQFDFFPVRRLWKFLLKIQLILTFHLVHLAKLNNGSDSNAGCIRRWYNTHWYKVNDIMLNNTNPQIKLHTDKYRWHEQKPLPRMH